MCVEVCRLQVYPQMDNGSKCERCGLAHSSVWQQARFASIDLVWSKGYNAGSALMGTTQSQMGQITQAVLLSEGFNVSLLHMGVPHRLAGVSQATAAAHTAPGLVLLVCMQLLFSLAGNRLSTSLDAEV